MGFSRQEYWSGVPLPSPTNLRGGPYSHTLTQQTRMSMFRELCIFPKTPELKDDGARIPPPLLPHFSFSMRVIPCPSTACHPAFWQEEKELTVFQFLYLISGRTQPLWAMSTCHHSQDPGPWPLQQCSRQDWKPGLDQQTPGCSMGAMQILAGQVSQEDGRKETHCWAQNPLGITHGPQALGSVTIFCPRSSNPATGVGQLPLHPRSGAGSMHRILPP